MSQESSTPSVYQSFIETYPELAEAWGKIGEAGRTGPLDEKTVRLVKLALAIGASREGAVHAGVRKAIAAGVSKEQMAQVVALAAGTVGFPSTVAAYSWIQDIVK
jgi:4-carboxymuconolactone decarboxylase